MDTLARYYTQEKISQLLVNKLSAKDPRRILELGIGDGSLSSAAFNRWNEARYYGVDIDDKSVLNIKHNLPFVKIIHHNGLEHNIQINLNINDSSVDIALCNPPYLRHRITDEDKRLFNQVNLSSCSLNNHITTDIVFLAQNLLFLKDGCELGIILPDSVLTNHYYDGLRRDLLNNHNVKTIIQLPDKVFTKTEARTHILIMEKNSKGKSLVEVSKANKDGEIVQTIFINKNKLIKRMDFDFHYWSLKQSEVSTNNLTIEDIYISLGRGNKTKKYLSELGIPYFHTTSFNSVNNNLEFDTTTSDFPSNLTLAGPGDLLIARVGKRCIGRVSKIKKGYIPISDCIYKLTVKESYINQIFESLISKEGQTWFQANAHGVCARLISKSDLLKYRIY